MTAQTQFPAPDGFDVAKGDRGYFVVTFEHIEKPSFTIDGDNLFFKPRQQDGYLNVPIANTVYYLFYRLDEIPVISCCKSTGKIIEIQDAKINLVYHQ